MAGGGNITLKNSRIGIVCLLIFLIGTNHLSSALTKKRELLFFFDKIEINGAVDVFVKPGTRNAEAFIYADSSVMEEIGLNVRERTLFIEANNTFDISRRLPFLKLSAERTFPVEIILHTEKLSELRLNGKGNLVISKIRTPKLSVHTTGSGRFHMEDSSIDHLSIRQDGIGPIVLKGQEVSSLELIVMNEGPILAQSLPVDRARIIHHGNGDIQINPIEFLDSRIMGAGNILIHQKPESIVLTQKGLGKVVDIIPDTPKLYDFNATNPNPVNRQELRKITE